MLRQILSNTAFQLLAKFIGAGLTFITTVLIIRLGGPELFGDLTKTLALIAIGFTAIDFGLNAEAVRSMKGDLDSQRRIFSDLLIARILLSGVAVVAVNVIIYLLPGGYTPDVKSVFWVGSLAIFFQGLYTSTNAWFQRRLEYWKMSVSTIIGTLVGTLLTYLAIINSPTLFRLLAASTWGYIVMASCSLLLIPRIIPNSKIFNCKSSLRLLKRSLPLGLILILSIVASKVDSVMLGVFRPSGEVGQYGFAYRIFDVILVLPVFVMNSIYPLLVESGLQTKKTLISRSMLSLFLLGLLGALVFYSLAPLLDLVRPGMTISISSLRLLVLSLPLFYLTAPLMWQLIEARLEKYLLIVYFVAAFINGITNLIFVPRFGAVASALLTWLTEATILTGLLLVRRRYLKDYAK